MLISAAEKAANKSETNIAHFKTACDLISPKRDELTRIADALENALKRRTQILHLSKNMHEKISQVNYFY